MVQTPASQPDVTTKDSPWSVGEAARRLSALITSRGMTIFATIDQRAAARSVEQDLRDTALILFGSPAAGTPVMAAVPLAALDLPLRALIWDDDGQTRLSYLSPSAFAARYAVPASVAAPLAGIDPLTDALLAGAQPG